ncbi:MAG: hypothetical protein ACE5D3_04795, partial [Candidatus Binatia bacterium]
MANQVAYGFVDIQHLFAQRLEEVGTRNVYDAIQATVDEWNRQAAAMTSSLVFTTTLHKERFHLPGGETLQPLDEHGNPRVVKPAGNYDVAYPIQGGGTAWGDNRVSRALMTVAEANRNTLNAMRADADWMRRHILAAIFDNVAWSFGDDRWGSLTIEPLANSDAVTYLKKDGSQATDDHYLNQSSAISDSNNPYPTMRQELDEHPSNAAPYVAYIPSGLRTATEGLTGFVSIPDADVRYGTQTDLVGNAINPGFGDEVLGKIEGE